MQVASGPQASKEVQVANGYSQNIPWNINILLLSFLILFVGSAGTWVTVQRWVVLAVAACESSGAAALVQAGFWILTLSSILMDVTHVDINAMEKTWKKRYKNKVWRELADLAWLIFTGGTVCDPSRAAIKVFKDDFVTLDDQLTDTTCTETIFIKDNVSCTENFYKTFGILPTKPDLMPAVLARIV